MARLGNDTPVQKLDTNGASAIYKAMTEFDSIIGKQQQIINNANLDIVEAMGKMERAYAERKNLSDQLDKFAPDDFMQPRDTDSAAGMTIQNRGMGVMYAPPAPPAAAPYPYGYSPKPWHKPSPMPQRVRSAPTPGFTDGEF